MNLNNIMNSMNRFNSFMQNPISMISQMGLNLPTNVDPRNPNQIMQSFVSQGRFSQSQINMANQYANQIRNNPAFKNMFNP